MRMLFLLLERRFSDGNGFGVRGDANRETEDS